MNNINGYRATLEAFAALPRFSKLVVSAAGKIEPAKVIK
jgi:NAD/NADP transhydrogenase alpha subunit